MIKEVDSEIRADARDRLLTRHAVSIKPQCCAEAYRSPRLRRRRRMEQANRYLGDYLRLFQEEQGGFSVPLNIMAVVPESTQ